MYSEAIHGLHAAAPVHALQSDQISSSIPLHHHAHLLYPACLIFLIYSCMYKFLIYIVPAHTSAAVYHLLSISEVMVVN
jgi:hypothetical protein